MNDKKLLNDLFRAYYDARKNKRKTINALEFETNYEENLFRLFEDIKNRKYEIGKSICFISKKPVKREIFAATFRDRIVHHLIYNYINSVFEKHFIKDSYSCRKGKGTSCGIKRIDHHIRSGSKNYTRDCYILKLDIKGYFMSMDRRILFEKMEKRLLNLKKPDFDVDLVLYLLRLVIFHDPTKNCQVKGKRENWVGLPRSKSLFFAGKGKGFPIGNLTSQLFGNVYLDDFDHFVREKLECKNYGRYVDDMIIVHPDRDYLKLAIVEIKKYLRDNLGLLLHPRKIYLQHYRKGVSFLGMFIKSHRIYVGRRIKSSFYEKLMNWNRKVSLQEKIENREIKRTVAVFNSYLGSMIHCNAFKLRKKMVGQIRGGAYLSVSKACKKIEVRLR